MKPHACPSCGQALPRGPAALGREYIAVCRADSAGFERAFGVRPPYSATEWAKMRAGKAAHERGLRAVFGGMRL